MWQNTDGGSDDQHDVTSSSETSSSEGSPSPIVAPSPDAWALVRKDDLPASPPDELVPYTIRADDDWLLTDDALAFGPPMVIKWFSEWRSVWERRWALEPVSSVLRLFDLARHLDPDTAESERGFEHLTIRYRCDDGDVVIPPVALIEFRDALRHVAELVRARAAHGYGVVDLTPDADRVGLARAWPSWGPDEVVAANDGLEVVLVPATGLYLRSTESDGSVSTVGPIDHVAFEGAHCTVSGEHDAVTVSSDRARALSWLVPGATAWRIRRIPEIVAWSKTFAGLDECLTEAADRSLPVRLTSRRPIADVSAGTATT